MDTGSLILPIYPQESRRMTIELRNIIKLKKPMDKYFKF
ncbi:hypothetical protein N836_14815 [Leptolyngbya sp. Heron Island J]|nr:hypothetical protein N836_14815 [Leptolyngbya sp. Heron Island J]